MEVTLSIPESLKDFIEAEVAAGGHGTAENYIQALLLEVRKWKAPEHVEALLGKV